MGDHLKKQALCIASVASNLDNFNRNNVKILQELGYEVTLAANFCSKEDINSQEKINSFAKEMRAIGVHITHIDFARSPRKLGMQIKSILQVRKLLSRNFDLIHCHTPVCAVIVRALAQKYRRKNGTRVLYTAHGFHFYSGAPLKNWLIFYPIEKWMSRYTDVLITINKEDYKRAKTKFHAKKTVYVPGVGVDTEKFGWRFQCDEIREKIRKKREEIGVPVDAKLIISVGELSARKNHKIVVEALNNINNSNIFYVIVGRGLQKDRLKKLDKTGRLILLGYRTDIVDLLNASDLFIFPSIQEGLPVALMEAMAAGVPCVVSRIRGNTDLIKENEMMFSPYAKDEVEHSISKIIREDQAELGKKNSLIIQGFSIKAVNKQMAKIYVEQMKSIHEM